MSVLNLQNYDVQEDLDSPHQIDHIIDVPFNEKADEAIVMFAKEMSGGKKFTDKDIENARAIWKSIPEANRIEYENRAALKNATTSKKRLGKL